MLNTVDPVVVDNPMEGSQLYVDAPAANRVVVRPAHIVVDPAVVIEGKGLTVIVTTAVPAQPEVFTPVTVYVLLLLVVVVTLPPVVAESPAAGLQL